MRALCTGFYRDVGCSPPERSWSHVGIRHFGTTPWATVMHADRMQCDLDRIWSAVSSSMATDLQEAILKGKGKLAAASQHQRSAGSSESVTPTRPLKKLPMSTRTGGTTYASADAAVHDRLFIYFFACAEYVIVLDIGWTLQQTSPVVFGNICSFVVSTQFLCQCITFAVDSSFLVVMQN